MNKNILKRSLSLMLALVLCFGMLPVSALAAEAEDPTITETPAAVSEPVSAEAPTPSVVLAPPAENKPDAQEKKEPDIQVQERQIPQERATAKVSFSVQNGAWAEGAGGTYSVEVPLTEGRGTVAIPTGMTPNPGYGPEGSWDSKPSETVTGNAAYTYTFPAIPYAVTVEGGSADAASATVGQTVILTPEQRDHQVFEGWEAADVQVEGGRFTMPAAAVTVRARFAEAFVVTVDGQTALVKKGTEFTVPAPAENNKTFVRWTGDVPAGKESVKSFTFIPEQDVVLTSVYKASITLNAVNGHVDGSEETQTTKEVELPYTLTPEEAASPFLPNSGFDFPVWDRKPAAGLEITGHTEFTETFRQVEALELFLSWQNHDGSAISTRPEGVSPVTVAVLENGTVLGKATEKEGKLTLRIPQGAALTYEGRNLPGEIGSVQVDTETMTALCIAKPMEIRVELDPDLVLPAGMSSVEVEIRSEGVSPEKKSAASWHSFGQLLAAMPVAEGGNPAVTVSKGSPYAGSFRRFTQEGKTITYTVVPAAGSGENLEVTGNASAGFKATKKGGIRTGKLTVSSAWVDADGAAIPGTEDQTLEFFVEGQPEESFRVELGKGGSVSRDIPVEDLNGKPLSYAFRFITGQQPEGFKTVIQGTTYEPKITNWKNRTISISAVYQDVKGNAVDTPWPEPVTADLSCHDSNAQKDLVQNNTIEVSVPAVDSFGNRLVYTVDGPFEISGNQWSGFRAVVLKDVTVRVNLKWMDGDKPLPVAERKPLNLQLVTAKPVMEREIQPGEESAQFSVASLNAKQLELVPQLLEGFETSLQRTEAENGDVTFDVTYLKSGDSVNLPVKVIWKSGDKVISEFKLVKAVNVTVTQGETQISASVRTENGMVQLRKDQPFTVAAEPVFGFAPPQVKITEQDVEITYEAQDEDVSFTLVAYDVSGREIPYTAPGEVPVWVTGAVPEALGPGTPNFTLSREKTTHTAKLPIYDPDNLVRLDYSVTAGDDRHPLVHTGDPATGFKIFSAEAVQTKDVEAAVLWQDYQGKPLAAAPQKANVTVKAAAGGNSFPVELKKPEWTGKVSVPAVDGVGNALEYTLTLEGCPENFTQSFDAGTNTFTLKHDPTLMEVKPSAKFVSSTGAVLSWPETLDKLEVTVKESRNAVAPQALSLTKEAPAGKLELPASDIDGKPCTYVLEYAMDLTVGEQTFLGEEQNYAITYTENVTLKATVVWKDAAGEPLPEDRKQGLTLEFLYGTEKKTVSLAAADTEAACTVPGNRGKYGADIADLPEGFVRTVAAVEGKHNEFLVTITQSPTALDVPVSVRWKQGNQTYTSFPDCVESVSVAIWEKPEGSSAWTKKETRTISASAPDTSFRVAAVSPDGKKMAYTVTASSAEPFGKPTVTYHNGDKDWKQGFQVTYHVHPLPLRISLDKDQIPDMNMEVKLTLTQEPGGKQTTYTMTYDNCYAVAKDVLLPVYDEAGNPCTYTLTSQDPNYSIEGSACSGFKVRGHVPMTEAETGAQILWRDQNGKSIEPPKKFTKNQIQIYARAKGSQNHWQVVGTIPVTHDGHWMGTVTVPAQDSAGNPLEYWAGPAIVPKGFKASVSTLDNSGQTFIITMKKIPSKPSWIPRTGDDSNVMLWAAAGALSLAALAGYGAFCLRKKKKK